MRNQNNYKKIIVVEKFLTLKVDLYTQWKIFRFLVSRFLVFGTKVLT